MPKQSEISVSKFELFQVEHFIAKEADGAKIQYDDFLSSVVRQNLSSLEEFNFFDLPLNQFLSPHLHRNNKCQLWKVCIFIFAISHGQSPLQKASISVNIWWLRIYVKYLQEVRGWSTIISSRDVKLLEYTIPKEFFLSCRQAHSNYEEAQNPVKKTRGKEIWRKMRWLILNGKNYLWNGLSSLCKLMLIII